VSDVLLGVTLPQFTGDRQRFIDGARRAEAAGLDSIWVFDHLWPLSGGKDRPIIEAWTAVSYLAGVTTRVRVGTLVTRSSLRHPALLAKMVATVASIAPGRLIVALGSGDAASKGENEAFGLDYFDADRRVDQLTSTVRLVRSFLHESAVSQVDGHVAVSDLPTSPPSASAPLWVAGRSDEVLDAAGRLADGWNGWGGTPDDFARDAATVIEAAAGRAVELTWGGLVALDETDAAARAKLGSSAERDDWVVGGPHAVAGHLAAMRDAGARHLICTFNDAGRPGAYELLADAVRPLL
jgi:alkanesulfonate monooxygenase SsuD/methylene tetrahydromethanopterin reductase-like flavin-dependent oxidoreductase (luciferase family)